jgi:hypothetical protein
MHFYSVLAVLPPSKLNYLENTAVISVIQERKLADHKKSELKKILPVLTREPYKVILLYCIFCYIRQYYW